ncbi:hypothetical protein BDR07DRAFT_1503663, partial [Suillus spraguei]
GTYKRKVCTIETTDTSRLPWNGPFFRSFLYHYLTEWCISNGTPTLVMSICLGRLVLICTLIANMTLVTGCMHVFSMDVCQGRFHYSCHNMSIPSGKGTLLQVMVAWHMHAGPSPHVQASCLNEGAGHHEGINCCGACMKHVVDFEVVGEGHLGHGQTVGYLLCVPQDVLICVGKITLLDEWGLDNQQMSWGAWLHNDSETHGLVMVLEKLEQFNYKTKSVQWWKLLDVAYQNKFQFELWPDKVHPVGPDFNYHTLSAQHLKLLIVPYIKHRAKQYYNAELKTEAENLLELQCKQGCSDNTLDDIIDELDVTVSEIDIVPWPEDHIEQCEKCDPKMFDIPLVTSASHVILWKLADSEKFKHCIPKALLQHASRTPPSGTSATDDAASQVTTCRRLRKKSKVVHYHDAALDIELPSQHFVPAHLQPQPQPRPCAHSPDYEPPQRQHNEALREWLQGDMRDLIMAGTLYLLVIMVIYMIMILITVTNVLYTLN